MNSHPKQQAVAQHRPAPSDPKSPLSREFGQLKLFLTPPYEYSATLESLDQLK